MRPFLKWAGSKYRLIDKINGVLPEGRRLIEPFVGSGAVFLNTNFEEYLLSDVNPDLINLYLHLQSEGEEFIEFTKSYFVPENNNPVIFYEMRSLFNATSDSRLKSALFIYLNRHCFNGLCRYNSKGGFNVPFGKYKNPRFPENEMKAFFIKSKKATFKVLDFKVAMESAVEGDVVYCDPPYVPLSLTSNFTDYAIGGFGLNKQDELALIAIKLQKRRIPVVISNHDTPFIRNAYQNSNIIAFEVQRYISCDSKNRNKAAEVLAVFSEAA
jgi:DNA adenine methylase